MTQNPKTSMKGSFSNIYRNFTVLLLIFLLSISSAFGQITPEEVDDPEIFPFSSMDYTEDLYEVTDEGIFDLEGGLVEEIVESDQLFDASDELDSRFIEASASDSKDAFEEYKESIVANWGSKKAFTEYRLEGIRSNLDDELNRFKLLDAEIEKLEEKLEPYQKEIQNIQDQIDLLNHHLKESKLKIKSAELMIADKQILLKKLMEDMKRSEIELNIQRNIVLEYIVMVYAEEEKFLDIFSNSSSTFKILLADNSVGENLLGREYLSALERTGREVFYKLNEKSLVLEEERQSVLLERAKLDQLYVYLEEERNILQEGKHSQKELLVKISGEEAEYQQLLEESIQQQLESAIAVQNLRDNIEFIEEKLELLDESLDRAESLSADSEAAQALFELESEVEGAEEKIEEEFESGISKAINEVAKEAPSLYPFAWPVPPLKVTTYFEDPNYPKKWGIHKALDLRARQYTEIRAPANAYVFQTKDNGMGYSYIILAHKNKLITVYGHVSKIIAKSGSVVKKGEVIALSGATPGTKGAGWQTTGPHLHFEVWHNGEQVDPLDYLPVMELPIEYVPDRYLTE